MLYDLVMAPFFGNGTNTIDSFRDVKRLKFYDEHSLKLHALCYVKNKNKYKHDGICMKLLEKVSDKSQLFNVKYSKKTMFCYIIINKSMLGLNLTINLEKYVTREINDTKLINVRAGSCL